VHHKTPAGAIVLPKHPPDGERKVGDRTFHYNEWWPSAFDRETCMRGSAKNGDLKPLDRMGCLDVDVLKKHGSNAKCVTNDPIFFFTLLFPICPPSRIEGDKCISVNEVEGYTRMPYFSTLAQFTNVYASMSDSCSGMGHEWHSTSTTATGLCIGLGYQYVTDHLMDGHIQSMLVGNKMILDLTLSLQIIFQTVI
jgi:hypothetical protein